MNNDIRDLVRETLDELERPVMTIDKLNLMAIPEENPRGGFFLIEVAAYESAQEAAFRCGLVKVPERRRRALVEMVNDLNGEYKPFVRWSLIGGAVGLSVGCELMGAYPAHAKRLVALGYHRMVTAIREDAQRVLVAVEKGYNPKAEAVAQAEQLVKSKKPAAK